MSDNQPIENFGEEWIMDPMLSSGQQLYASGATVGGCSHSEHHTRRDVNFEIVTVLDPGWELHQASPPSIFATSQPQPCYIQPSQGQDGLGNESNTLSSGTAFNDHICYKCSPFRTFGRLGDLTRHQNEKHNPVAASKYLCPVDICPRSIQGEGFGRMHHLVAHLKSKKHGIDTKEATYVARMHNLPKSKAREAGQGAQEAM